MDAAPPAHAPDLAASSAYEYPLIIKQLLITPLRQFPDQEIVYRDTLRFTYRQFGERVRRLGSALGTLGVGQGTTVAVMDWDSRMFLCGPDDGRNPDDGEHPPFG